MSNQYFENNKNLPSEERVIDFYFKQNIFHFYTDLGVFSKREIDFGSSLLLKSIEIEPVQKRALDVGCGYGPLGIILAKTFPQLQVDMVDVNLRALTLAKKNAGMNNVYNIAIFESDIYQAIQGKYDVIISNPPIRAGKKIVHEILLSAPQYLTAEGNLWIVIQKKQGAPSAIKKLQEVFSNVEVMAHDKGYYIIKSSFKKS